MNANGEFLDQSRGKAPVLTNPDGPNVGQASRLPGGMDVWFEKSLLLRTSEPGGKMPPSTAAKMAAATDVNPALNTYHFAKCASSRHSEDRKIS